MSAEVTVETPDSKWEITEGGKVYEVEYRNFENDAKDAKIASRHCGSPWCTRRATAAEWRQCCD